jgi:hypothetical protein
MGGTSHFGGIKPMTSDATEIRAWSLVISAIMRQEKTTDLHDLLPLANQIEEYLKFGNSDFTTS